MSASAARPTSPSIRARSARSSPRCCAGSTQAPSLPWASSLCGACYEVCPVKIDIPSILVHLRGRVVREQKSSLSPEALAMKGMAPRSARAARYEGAQRLARLGRGPLAKAACRAGRRCATCPSRPRRRSATGGSSVSARAALTILAARRGAALGAGARRPGRSRATIRARSGAGSPARRRSSTSSASASPSTARPCTASPPASSPPRSRAILAGAAPASASRPGFAPLGIDVDRGRRPRRSRELDTLDARGHRLRAAIADTGTIVLDSGPRSGPPRAHARPRPPRLHRRAPATIVASVPDAIAALDAAAEGRRSRSSPARRRRRTSSSTASRASTARASST